MSHVKFWKKSLVAVLVAVASQVVMADDPVPAFMQYNKPATSATKPVVGTPTPVANQPAVAQPETTVAPLPTAQKAPAPMPVVGHVAAPTEIKPLPEVPKPVMPIAGTPPSSITQPVPMPTKAIAGPMGMTAPVPVPMDGRYHEPMHALSPDTLSQHEQLNQLQKSEAESEASLWQARAKQAEAQAAYEAAMKKITETQTPPPPPVDPKASAAIAQLNAMAAREGFDGIKIMSTYGETHGRMYADVTLNGTPMTVTRGDMLGEWRVAKIGTTYVKVWKKGEHKELFIHATQQ